MDRNVKGAPQRSRLKIIFAVCGVAALNAASNAGAESAGAFWTKDSIAADDNVVIVDSSVGTPSNSMAEATNLALTFPDGTGPVTLGNVETAWQTLPGDKVLTHSATSIGTWKRAHAILPSPMIRVVQDGITDPCDETITKYKVEVWQVVNGARQWVDCVSSGMDTCQALEGIVGDDSPTTANDCVLSSTILDDASEFVGNAEYLNSGTNSFDAMYEEGTYWDTCVAAAVTAHQSGYDNYFVLKGATKLLCNNLTAPINNMMIK